MIQIAIDGPAGSGKSTIAKCLSKRLHINYMDTGATYRALAYALVDKGIAMADTAAVCAALEDMQVHVRYTQEGQRVFVGEQDVTDYIRTPQISKAASDVAVIPEVRCKLVAIQRATADRYDIVMDGRDIGTYVLPDAPLKFYVTASTRVRAQRRKLEQEAAGIETNLDALEQEIIARDHTDSTREFAPLKQAADAHFIDTTTLTIEQVMDVVMRKVEEVYGDVL